MDVGGNSRISVRVCCVAVLSCSSRCSGHTEIKGSSQGVRHLHTGKCRNECKGGSSSSDSTEKGVKAPKEKRGKKGKRESRETREGERVILIYRGGSTEGGCGLSTSTVDEIEGEERRSGRCFEDSSTGPLPGQPNNDPDSPRLIRCKMTSATATRLFI